MSPKPDVQSHPKEYYVINWKERPFFFSSNGWTLHYSMKCENSKVHCNRENVMAVCKRLQSFQLWRAAQVGCMVTEDVPHGCEQEMQ